MAAFRGKAGDGRRLFASRKHNVAGWSSPVAREAHNLEVAGSNPVPAISRPPGHPWPQRAFLCGFLPLNASLKLA